MELVRLCKQTKTKTTQQLWTADRIIQTCLEKMKTGNLEDNNYSQLAGLVTLQMRYSSNNIWKKTDTLVLGGPLVERKIFELLLLLSCVLWSNYTTNKSIVS